ncbi:hypothetical protein AO385_1340 [Moraxella catarrhalis]|uniref:Uncharacterized protein n=1 Tax=Moraxella catarrhalis TaxID=480 RepID=A0A7Z0UW91_MORCA|nr:hypothetical protein AO382_2283 [Moraxella catarrhalis]OAU99732.1 hypothetical protein AO385_1340 [Moraxella catarrhalis]
MYHFKMTCKPFFEFLFTFFKKGCMILTSHPKMGRLDGYIIA